MQDFKISDHFSFFELTNTSHSELLDANRKDASDNKAVLKNLKYIAGALEEIRDVLNTPLKVSSGYRNKALNKAVGGSPTSKHSLGLCADIIPSGMSVQDAFKLLTIRKSELHSVRKVIIEGKGSGAWLHVQAKVDAKEAMEFYTSADTKNFTKVG